MTNPTCSHLGPGLDPETLVPAHTGAAPRPVKVVQHPAFRGRAHPGAAARQVLPLRVVSLNDPTDATDGRSIPAVLRLDVLTALAGG